MRGRVVAPVGLALDDAPSDAVDEQLAADQVVRDLEAAARAPAGDVGHAGAASTRERTRRLPAICAALQTTRP